MLGLAGERLLHAQEVIGSNSLALPKFRESIHLSPILTGNFYNPEREQLWARESCPAG